MEVDFVLDGKVLKKIQDTIKMVHEQCSLFLISLENDSSKINFSAIVSKHHESQGLDAREWCDFCVTKLGAGKGGGKVDMASASLLSSERVSVSDILRYANEYITGLSVV